MKITLLSDDAIRLEPLPGPLTVEASSADMQYSPFHMLASGLATCTFSVLHSWATHKKLAWEDLALDVRWTFADDPHRVNALEVTFTWPSLPPERVATASRVAALCTVHATLSHPPTITIAPASGAPATGAPSPATDAPLEAVMHGDPAAAPPAPTGVATSP